MNNPVSYYDPSGYMRCPPTKENSYDTVSGPMLRNPIKKFYEGRVPAKSSGQQTAFNTQDAIDLLNKYMKGK